jgi:hypothetical protein
LLFCQRESWTISNIDDFITPVVLISSTYPPQWASKKINLEGDHLRNRFPFSIIDSTCTSSSPLLFVWYLKQCGWTSPPVDFQYVMISKLQMYFYEGELTTYQQCQDDEIDAPSRWQFLQKPRGPATVTIQGNFWLVSKQLEHVECGSQYLRGCNVKCTE